MRIDSPVMTNAVVTGSFSGSFVGTGNFTGLEADSVEFANVLNKPTLLSGSEQIASDISGSFTSVSASLAADIATNTAAIANLDGSYATDAELNASSSALITAYGNADTTLSASLATDIAVNTAKVGYTDALVKLKLNNDSVVSGSAAQVRSFLNVEDGATGDQTASEIKTAYESNANTNAFTDTLLSKLNGIEASADVTDTANVTAAGAVMDSEVDADIKTLSLPANTTISSFAQTFLDDADAAAVRATIGAEASGADNSTDVTLVTTSHDYLSLSGQAITLGQIDISDDTNFAISDTTGQTGINLTLTGDTLSGVVSGLDTTSNVQFNNLTVSGDLTVSGTTTSINSTDLNVADKLISINRGGTTAASADGGGLFISGANESITWDNGNSRFNFSDDVHAAGNITLTGTVDGRDVATDGTKLDGIEAGATADQTAAEIRTLVESATDSNVFTDADHSKLDGIEASAKDDQTITAGNGLTGGGTGDVTLNVVGTLNRISVTADAIDIASTYAGQSTITTLGTITTGTWAATDVAVAHGGTGASTAAGAATNLGLGTASNVQHNSLGIGTAAPGTTGVIRATNDIVAYYSSDERLKDNISEIPNALEKVESLRGVEFDWNDNQEVYSGHDIGVIAQDVEAILPEIVETRDNGYKAVKYEKLTAVLIQAVKELSAKVKELENK